MALKLALKGDFHLHTQDDPQDSRFVKHSAEALIDLAAKKSYQVLSITTHDKITYSPYLRDYAGHRGILLLPGAEVTIEGKHILLINYLGRLDFKRVEDLRDIKSDENLIIAAHPYYPGSTTLKKRLEKHIDLFDGIEFCHFYLRWFNFFNRKAVQTARTYHKPLVGTSDAHMLFQLGHTYSLIEVTEKSPRGVVQAIKRGDVRVVSEPLTLPMLLKIASHFGWSLLT